MHSSLTLFYINFVYWDVTYLKPTSHLFACLFIHATFVMDKKERDQPKVFHLLLPSNLLAVRESRNMAELTIVLVG